MYLVCSDIVYKYFEDYCKALQMVTNAWLIKYNNENEIVIIKGEKYIFFQLIPDQCLKFNDKNNFYVLNTEQLTVNKIMLEGKPNLVRMQRYIELGVHILDYDYYQSLLISSPRDMYLPYPLTLHESNYLASLVQNIPKIYDVAFCTLEGVPRRNHVNLQLMDKKIKVIDAIGWNHDRDYKIAQAKILINVHYEEDYQIFEHLRCDRWVLSGHLVLTESSLSDDLLDIKELLIIEKYENLASKAQEILQNYDQYYEQYNTKLKKYKQRIMDQRLEHLNLAMR